VLQTEQLLPLSGGGEGRPPQKEPALAFGAGVYLSAWVDNRVESGNGAGDVFVARWSDSGALLDPVGIAVGMAPESEIRPTVAFDGRNFLVAWSRYIFSPGEGHTETRAVRVSPTGAILDASPFLIEADGSAQNIAFDDSQWFVVAMVGWPDYQLSFTAIGESATFGARWRQGFPTDGDLYDVAGGAGMLFVAGGVFPAFPARRNWARLVDTASQAVKEIDLGPAANASTGRLGRAAVAWSGDAFYSAWGGEAQQSLELARITLAGERASASIVAASGFVMTAEALAATRDAALLLHKDLEDVASSVYGLRAQLLTLPSMQPVRDIVLDADLESGGNADAARGATSFGTAWDSGSTADSRVRFGALSDGVGAPATALLAPGGPIAQRGPAVAADDLGFSVVWCEESTEGSRVWLLRFDASGATRDADPIELGSGCGQSVARRDGRTFVAWVDGGGSATASITDQELSPTVSMRPNFYGSAWTPVPPVVTATLDGYAVAYIESPDDTLTRHFSVESVPSGATWLPPVPRRAGVLPALAGTSDGVAIAYIAFDSDTVGGPLRLELNSARTTRPLEVVPSGAWQPALSYAEGRLLVAWREGARDELKRIRVALVDEATWAVVDGPIDVSATGANSDRPAVAHDGAGFVIGWRQSLDVRGDLYLARVSLDGRLLDPTPVALTSNAEPEIGLAVASGPSGNVLSAYAQLDTIIGATRSRMRWLSTRAP
jgi:hypothetical protein